MNVPQLLLLDVRMGQWHGPDLYEALCTLEGAPAGDPGDRRA